MTTQKGRLACVILAGALMGGGCISTAPTTVEKRGLTYRVDVNSLILDNHIRVTERSARRVNNLLDVQVRGENVSGKDIQLEYRYVWLSESGAVADTSTSMWKPLALHAGETAFMIGMASSPDAVDFLLTIRFVGKSTRW